MNTQLPERRAVVQQLLAERDGWLVVSGLGGTTWDVAAAGDHPGNYYLWGGMGLAVSCGLGLALAQPERQVLVITGDGEMLMGVGSLATVARAGPRNLSIVVIDNERYGETGGQVTHTAGATDLVVMAHGAGIEDAREIRDAGDVSEFSDEAGTGSGPRFAVIKVATDSPALVLPPRDVVQVRERFRGYVAGGAVTSSPSDPD